MKKLLLTAMLCVSASLFAGEKVDPGSDPTKFITRYEVSHEYINTTNNDVDYQGATVFRVDYAFTPNTNLRLDVPIINTKLDGANGSDSDADLGNLVLQTLHKFDSREIGNGGWTLAQVGGLRVDLDTSTSDIDRAGQDGAIIAPLYAAGITNGLWLVAPVFQWYMGDEEGYVHDGEYIDERDRLSIRTLIAYQPVTKNFHSPISWVLFDPEYFVDFERDEKWLELGVEVGKMISPTKAVFVKPTFHVAGSDKSNDFRLKVGFRHMFPGKYFFN